MNNMTTKEALLEEMVIYLKEYQNGINPENPEDRQPIDPKYFEIEKTVGEQYNLYFEYHIRVDVVLYNIDKILNPPETEDISALAETPPPPPLPTD